jgi:hypothetical protein
MVQGTRPGTSGALTDAIVNLLETRERMIQRHGSIDSSYVWQIPVYMTPLLGFMIDINECLLMSLDQKYDRAVIINDIVRYIYKQVEEKLFENDDDEIILQ